MATTSYGTNHPLAVKLWSKKLFREALKSTTMAPFIGSDSNSAIQFVNDTQKGPGDTIYLPLRVQLSGDGIQADGTLEGNEEALTTYRDTLVIDQLRHAVRSGGKMSEQRIPFSVRDEARMGLQDWWQNRIDTSLVNQLAGNTGQADTRYSGNQSTTAPTTTTNNSRWLLGINGNSTTEASVSTTELFNLTFLDQVAVRAKLASPVIRPLKVSGKDYFVVVLHTHQLYDLRKASSTAGTWFDVQKAALTGGKIADNPLFTGAAGVYNNIIIYENTRVPQITANTRRGFLMGAQAGAFGVGQDNTPEKMSWVEELFDYENQLGVAAGMIFGAKKTVFNSIDFGTIAISSYVTAP